MVTGPLISFARETDFSFFDVQVTGFQVRRGKEIIGRTPLAFSGRLVASPLILSLCPSSYVRVLYGHIGPFRYPSPSRVVWAFS